jgi:hypothetical protein
MRAFVEALTLVVCLSPVVSATAGAPHIVNGTVDTRATTRSLPTEIEAVGAGNAGVIWVGYAVPANRAGEDVCCYESHGDRHSACCHLEDGEGDHHDVHGTIRGVHLEPSGESAVFVRLDAGVPGMTRAYSTGCEVNAGGRRVVWLTGVKPAESVAWLAGRAADEGETRGHRDGIVAAIAVHADVSADRVLEQVVFTGSTVKLQESAVFWMGAARGATGFAVLKRALDQLQGDKLREHVVFAISISKEPGVTETLVQTAKHDRSSHVRGQALFWLGQKAGDRVAGTLVDAVRDDPDTEVKTKAVFALSQLPKDEGVPLLINIARTHKNLEVRKQAMFWLGQSKDPRALVFFEEILAKD